MTYNVALVLCYSRQLLKVNFMHSYLFQSLPLHGTAVGILL